MTAGGLSSAKIHRPTSRSNGSMIGGVARPSAAPSIGCADRFAPLASAHHRGGGSRWHLWDATPIGAPGVHCAGVAGWMFLLFWNALSGSYLALTSASRS